MASKFFSWQISFDPTYGLALGIIDIDPGYILGDLEREKQEQLRNYKTKVFSTKTKHLNFHSFHKELQLFQLKQAKDMLTS